MQWVPKQVCGMKGFSPLPREPYLFYENEGREQVTRGAKTKEVGPP